MGKISPQAQKALEQLKRIAREEIIAKGELTIKLEPDTMRSLMELADTLRVPVGVLVRNWIEENLDKVKTDG